MITILLVMFILGFPGQSPQRTIQIVSPQNEDYSQWQLKKEDGTTHPFDEMGQVTVTMDRAELSFEIRDGEGRLRFLGLWGQLPEEDPIRLQVNGPQMQVHQVVTTSRVARNAWQAPADIQVIRPEEQPGRAAPQTADWLKEDAGILLQKTNLGGGSPIIRGMSGNRILLMVDGFRLNNGTFRLGLNQYLNTVSGGNIAQIETLSGPTGVQYGSDGLGGTVHIRSQDPASGQEDHIGYTGLYSTADDSHTHKLSGSSAWNNIYFQGHFTSNIFEDLKAGGDVDEQPATGFESVEGSANLTWAPKDKMRLRWINSFSNAGHVPRTDRIASGRDLLWEYQPQRFRMHGLKWEHQLGHGWADYYELGLGFMRQEEGIRRISTNSPNTRTDDLAVVHTLQVNGTFRKLTQQWELVFGFDGQWDNVEAWGFQTDLSSGSSSATAGKFPDDSAWGSFGAFISAEHALTRAQRIRFGVRETVVKLEGTLAEPIGHVRQQYDQQTPSASWSYTKGSYFTSAGISQGFRAPSLEDTLSLGFSNQGFDAPNPNLGPELLWSYEWLNRWRNGNHAVQTSMYYSRLQDLVDRVPGQYNGHTEVEGEPVFMMGNVGKAKIVGATTQYWGNLSPSILFGTDAAWTRGTEDEGNKPMRRIPPLRGNVHLRYIQPRYQLAAAFSWAARQDRLSNGDISDSRIPEGGTPGYGVVHLRSQINFTEKVLLKLAVENLGDKLYKQHGSGIYEPGRRLLIQLSARWN